MNSILKALILIFFCLQTEAKTLIITDVDDTLKVAHVLNKWDAFKLAFRTDRPFYGMNDLFQDMKLLIPDTHFVYLSNAPAFLMQSTHESFLKNNNFPEGDYIPRSKYSVELHKLTYIRKYIQEEKPDHVIFLGDNGEKDSPIYHQIVVENQMSGIVFSTFIREVYSSTLSREQGAKLFVEQIGFVTSLDIELALFMKNIYPISLINVRLNYLLNEIEFENQNTEPDDRIVFPEFETCSDYIWYWENLEKTIPALVRLKEIVQNRCVYQDDKEIYFTDAN